MSNVISGAETGDASPASLQCPQCKASMTIARIIPDKPNHEVRTYRCGVCGAEEVRLIRLK